MNTIFAKFNKDGFVQGFWQSAAYDDPETVIPVDAIEITEAQFKELFDFQGLRKWVNGQVVVYDPPTPEPIIPDRVSRRQFRQQLFNDGLLAPVEAWVSLQDERTKMAYADSGTFIRTDEMLQNGFNELGFTTQRVDKFFTDASLL